MFIIIFQEKNDNASYIIFRIIYYSKYIEILDFFLIQIVASLLNIIQYTILTTY